MHLRRALPEDAGGIVSLWKDAEATESVTDTVEEVRRIVVRDNVAFILAISEGGIVGAVIGAFDGGWRGNIYRLAVHPSYRRRGIARTLMAATEKAFAGWKVKRVTALVEKEHEWAVRFWETVGYLPDHRMTRFVRNLAVSN